MSGYIFKRITDMCELIKKVIKSELFWKLSIYLSMLIIFGIPLYFICTQYRRTGANFEFYAMLPAVLNLFLLFATYIFFGFPNIDYKKMWSSGTFGIARALLTFLSVVASLIIYLSKT
jgi:hypothetical protein